MKTTSFLGSANPLTDSVDEYIFWNGKHPTRTAHGILGEFVVATLVANASDQTLRLKDSQDLDITNKKPGIDFRRKVEAPCAKHSKQARPHFRGFCFALKRNPRNLRN